MASSYSAQRTVKLDDVRQNNIVLVDLNESLRDSVFINEYRKAAEIIRGIIADNQEKAKTEKYNLTELQTAVPFIGDRGTGKSSIMCSVLETLKYYKGGDKEAAFYLGEDNQNTRFVTFDTIDATPLKAGEDIMEIILSRMLSYLENLSNGSDFRELYRLIDELHVDLGRTYWKDTNKRERCGIVALQQVAESKKTITSFQKLVDEFTRAISAYQFGGKPCYLVVALDDIDMYQGACNGSSLNQFALLEHIYYHMRVPGLIVLMTYNEHILRRKCNQHFLSIYNGSMSMKEFNQSVREDIDGLTAQFMSKLFPQERRIYLPNYMFVDLENRSNLYVKPTLDHGLQDEKTELFTLFGQQDAIPVKEFILRLIAYKTGVHFDAGGSKKHFFEPRNLRELGELIQVILTMDKIPLNRQTQGENREHNRQTLLDYLYNQFALKCLASEEYREFRRISMLPLNRQERTLIDQIRVQRKMLDLLGDDVGYIRKTERDRWRYSYGELLHNLYYSTRIPKKKGADETFRSKEFIHCILGTHSVFLNQQIGRENSQETIRQSLGSSIAGRWANEMLPKFYYEGGRSPVAAGSISIPVRHFFDWELPIDVQNSLLNLLKTPTDDDIYILSLYIEALIICGMFFTGFPRNGLKITLVPDFDERKSPTIFLRSTSEDHICFNVLNFAINLYDTPEGNFEYISYIQKKILKLGQEFLDHFSNKLAAKLKEAEDKKKLINRVPISTSSASLLSTSPNIPEKGISDDQDGNIKETIDMLSKWMNLISAYQPDQGKFTETWECVVARVCDRIVADIVEWKTEYMHSRMVLPVQHFDMMYNIIKRLANIYYYDIPEEASVDEVYDHYIRLYERVAEELSIQDAAYNVQDSESFACAFQNSVFIKRFTAPKYNPYVEKIIVDMMKKALPAQYARTDTAGL